MKKQKTKSNSCPFVIIRSEGAGVFAGELVKRDGDVVELRNSRRLWYWSGAASLSELAERGTSKPGECKFPVRVSSQIVMRVLEVITCTDAARSSIESVKEWSVQ